MTDYKHNIFHYLNLQCHCVLCIAFTEKTKSTEVRCVEFTQLTAILKSSNLVVYVCDEEQYMLLLAQHNTTPRESTQQLSDIR